jgi:MFS family permease
MVEAPSSSRASAVGFGPRFVAAVSVGSVLNPVNSSIIAVALVTIGQVFDAGPDQTAWLVSGLYLATAVGQPTMGKLADRFGARRVYLAGLALVAAGGVLGFASGSLGLLVAARVTIGLGTSTAYPAAMAMVRRQSQRLNRPAPGSVLGALAIAAQVSSAVGPPLGGLLIAFGGWRSIFLVNLPLAAVGAVFAAWWLPADRASNEPEHRESSVWRALDPPGLVLFVAALASLLVFLMDVGEPHWWLCALALGLVAAFVGWELRADTPFLDVRMLVRNRELTATYARYAVTFLVSYSFLYGWTQWLEQSAGRSVAVTGLLLTPSFVVGSVCSALGARDRRVRGPLLIGTCALVLGSASLMLLDGDAPVWTLIGVSMLFGVPTGLNVVGNQAAMYAQAPDDQIGVASGLLRTFMYLGAVLSTSLIGTAFGQRATDTGLHNLALVLTVASVVLLAGTLLTARSAPPSHPR